MRRSKVEPCFLSRTLESVAAVALHVVLTSPLLLYTLNYSGNLVNTDNIILKEELFIFFAVFNLLKIHTISLSDSIKLILL